MKKMALAFVVLLLFSIATMFPVVGEETVMGPFPDELYYVVYLEPGAAVLALQTGEVDRCGVPTPEDALTLIEQGFTLTFASLCGTADACYNMEREPFNDKALRQALAYLVPVDEVIAEYISPLGERRVSYLGPAFEPWTTTEGVKVYDFDPGKAEQLLDAAGYVVHPDGDVRTYPNGTKLREISLMWVAAGPDVHFFERWADEMETLKIPVKREPAGTYGPLFYRWMNGDYDISQIGVGWVARPDILYMLFHSSQIGGGNINIARINNATLDGLIDTIMSSVDEEEVKQACYDAMRLLSEELPFIPFYEPKMSVAFNPDLMGVIEEQYSIWTTFRMRWQEEGGIVKWAVSEDPESLNPLVSVSWRDVWLARLFDGDGGLMLIASNPWTQEFNIPWACKSLVAEPTEEGGMKVTVELKPGMFWHDGVEVTAQDVAFCFEYSFNTGAPQPAAAVTNFINVTVVDKYTAELYYSKPSLWTKYNVAGNALWAPKHIWNNDTAIYGEPAGLPGIQEGYEYGVGDPYTFTPESVPYPGREDELTCLVGSGPWIFRPDSWHVGDYIRLEANRNYHKRPMLADINFDFKVDIRDVFTVAKAFGSELGHPRWNIVADINGDRIVNIRDIYLIAKDFGKTW